VGGKRGGGGGTGEEGGARGGGGDSFILSNSFKEKGSKLIYLASFTEQSQGWPLGH